MKSKSIRQIALWLKDRVEAGQYEENGSMDYTNCSRTKDKIKKDEGEYLVWMSDSAFPDFSITEQYTLKEIEKEIVKREMT